MRVDTERSSLTFVRPFLFDPEQVTLALYLIATANFGGRDSKLLVWEPVEFPTADWLPHIADSLVSTPGSPAVAAAFRLTNDFVQSGQGLGGKGFEYLPKKSTVPMPLTFDELQIILFRNGVGFVVQRWKVESDSPAVWLDLQHYGRFADPKRTCTLRRPNDPTATSFATLNTTALNTLTFGTVRVPTHDIFIAGRLLPYAVVFLTSGPDPEWHAERVLYKLRRLFHAVQPYHPDAEQVAFAPPNFHLYLKDQWFFQSLEGGGFAAIDAPTDGFFKGDLPKHLTTEYFLLFVLALHQRFTLMDLSAEVARRWPPPGKQSPEELRERRDVFEDIRERLFEFTARYQFVQVVQRENHHRVYQLWRETFQTKELYEEVSEEVREMSEYLHDRDRQAQEDRVNWMTVLFTICIGAPSLAIGFWNINIKTVTSSDGPDLWGAVCLVLGVFVPLVLLFGGLWWVVIGRHLKRTRPSGSPRTPR